jgi:hypothetical protein
MDGPNSINGARGSPDTIPRNDQADAFMASIANAKANQNRGPEANQLPQARPAELRSYTPSLRERIAWGIQDGLMALGAKAYEAGHLGRGLTDIMSLTPLGIPFAANDAGRAMQRRDWGGVLVSSLGMLPAAKPLRGRRAARCCECPQPWRAADRTDGAPRRSGPRRATRRNLADRAWNLGRLQGMVDQGASERRAATDERPDPLRPGARI